MPHGLFQSTAPPRTQVDTKTKATYADKGHARTGTRPGPGDRSSWGGTVPRDYVPDPDVVGRFPGPRSSEPFYGPGALGGPAPSTKYRTRFGFGLDLETVLEHSTL